MTKAKQQEFEEKIKSLQKQKRRFKRKYEVTYGFLHAKQNGVKLSDLIQQRADKQVHTVVIYGTGELGIYLLRELLTEKQIRVLYCLDQKPHGSIEGISVYQPAEGLEVPDLFLVTPIGILKDIEDLLMEKMQTLDTLSVEELF